MADRTKELVTLIGEDGKKRGIATVHQLPVAKYTRGFMTKFSDAAKYLVDSLTHFELRVLARLEERLDYGNWSPVIADEIAKDMKADKGNISTAISSLLAKGIIERAPRELKIGRIWQYRLSADYGWKGTATEWHQHQRERMKHGEVVQLFPVGSEYQRRVMGCDAVVPGAQRQRAQKVARLFRIHPPKMTKKPPEQDGPPRA